MEIDKIIREVDSSMAMVGMPLTKDDEQRLQKVFQNPTTLNTVIAKLVKSLTVPANE